MRLRRIQFPGKTLIVSTGDPKYQIFALYFIALWRQKFGTKPDLAISGESEAIPLLDENAYVVCLPGKFFRQWHFLIGRRYQTVVYLNPDLRQDRSLKWAARMAFIRNRAGFAPLRSFQPLNFSLPFNAENHHFVHQLKVFFEHLSGEKVLNWQLPRLLPDANHEGQRAGVIAVDVSDPAVDKLKAQLQNLINLVTRTASCTLLIRSNAADDGTNEQRIQLMAREISTLMTERAIENTHLILNPPVSELVSHLGDAPWVTGIDALVLNLAAFLGIPSLSVFGPLNERVWQPFSTRARVLTGDFPCRPCTPLPGKVTCTNADEWQCIRGLTGELWAATLTSMARRNNVT